MAERSTPAPPAGGEHGRIARAAGVVGGATLLSRMGGFARDMVIAGLFGAGVSSDAFFVAFRIPNLLRRLFAEGSLSMAFVPVFTACLSRDGRPAAFAFARSCLRVLALVLIAAALAGVWASPLIVRLIAPGFAGVPEQFALTVQLTRTMFPYIVCIGLVALCMGILNVLGHFAAPALAPLALNLAIIAAALGLSPHLDPPVKALALGVLAGGGLQLLMQLPALVRRGFRFWQPAGWWHPGLTRLVRLWLPTVLGAAVYQINILVNTLLASLLPSGSVSYLYYADRLVQFPLGIFAIALATAVLPSLARQAADKRFDDLADTCGHALSLVFYIAVPATAGLIVLREPIVALLFQRGAFDALTTQHTARALVAYAVGLWAFSGVRIIVSAYYALQDTRTPVAMAGLAIAANIGLGIVLMRPLGHVGLALATSLASMLNLGLLVGRLAGRLGRFDWRPVVVSACKTTCASVIMALVVGRLMDWLLLHRAWESGWPLAAAVAAGVAAGAGSFLMVTVGLGSREPQALWHALRRRPSGRLP